MQSAMLWGELQLTDQARTHENGKCQKDTNQVVSDMTRLCKRGKGFLKQCVNICRQKLSKIKAEVSIVFNMVTVTGNQERNSFRVGGEKETEVKLVKCE